MKAYVDCSTCKTDCPRAGGPFGYTFCDRYTPPAKPPTTNADHIRAMSDEELAKYIVNHRYFGRESTCLDWLRQPWEEAPHD